MPLEFTCPLLFRVLVPPHPTVLSVFSLSLYRFLWADPFDRPDNFPELVVNRIQASVKLLEAQPKPEVRFNKSLFGQLFGEMDGWANEKFRRCVNPTHGSPPHHFFPRHKPWRRYTPSPWLCCASPKFPFLIPPFLLSAFHSPLPLHPAPLILSG